MHLIAGQKMLTNCVNDDFVARQKASQQQSDQHDLSKPTSSSCPDSHHHSPHCLNNTQPSHHKPATSTTTLSYQYSPPPHSAIYTSTVTTPTTTSSRPSQPHDASLSPGSGGGSDGWQWPGVEVVVESYQHHVEELRLERQVLQDQCSVLQCNNRDLNRSAERLSVHMSVSMNINKPGIY